MRERASESERGEREQEQKQSSLFSPHPLFLSQNPHQNTTTTNKRSGRRQPHRGRARGHAGRRHHPREMGHRHPQGRRRAVSDQAGQARHHRRDPPAARLARARARVDRRAHAAHRRGDAGVRAARRPVGDAPQLRGRRVVPARRPQGGALPLRRRVQAVPACAAVHRRDGAQAAAALPADERHLLRKGKRIFFSGRGEREREDVFFFLLFFSKKLKQKKKKKKI